MAFDINLYLHSNPDLPMPPEYYEPFVGNFPDLVEKPCEEALDLHLESLEGLKYRDSKPLLDKAIRFLEGHPKLETLAYEQALSFLRVLRERAKELPRAQISISREGRSTLGHKKFKGLTQDDIDAGEQRQEENLAGNLDDDSNADNDIE